MSPADASDPPAGHGRKANPRLLVARNTVFFPAATAYAIIVLPASVFSMLGLTDGLPALASATGHTHEVLFGFALAVVAGNQLGPAPKPQEGRQVVETVLEIWIIFDERARVKT